VTGRVQHRQGRLSRGALLARGDQDVAPAEDGSVRERRPRIAPGLVLIEDLTVGRALGADQPLAT